MASFLENLERIIGVDLHAEFKKLVNIDLRKTTSVRDITVNGGIHFNLIVDPSAPKLRTTDKNNIDLNLHGVDPADVKTLIQNFFDGGLFLADETSAKKLESFQISDRNEESRIVIAELSDVVDAHDMLIIRAAIHLQRLHTQGARQEVATLKSEMIQKYGARGSKIANLYTSGYFGTQILPLLREMKAAPNFQKAKFQKMYDVLITESAFAVFVNNSMSVVTTKAAISERVLANAKYGIPYVPIHGIGTHNIATIRTAVEELLKENPDLDKEVENKTGDVLFVKLVVQKKDPSAPAV